MNIERVVDNVSYIAATTTDGEDGPLWMYLAAYLYRYSATTESGVHKLVTPKYVLPGTEEECKQLAQDLYHMHWTSEQDYLF